MSRRTNRWLKVGSLLVVLAVFLGACGAPATTTPVPTSTPKPTTAPVATPTPLIKGKVGIVLPDAYGGLRWVQDEVRFHDAFKAVGYADSDVQILFSQGDSAVEKANVETLIGQGIKVLILCPVDGTVAAAETEEARAAGIKVISYDQLIRDTEAVDYYVTFDYVAVGQVQGQYLVDHAQGKGNPLYLYAGRASDNNAFLYFQGAWEVLQPKIADGTFVIKNSSEAVALQTQATLTREEMSRIIGQITTGWSSAPHPGKDLAEANLKSAQAADKGKVFILAPNDATARAIADVFAADPDIRSYVITGQDAEEASVQYILDGWQSMTILEDYRTLVKDAVAVAVAYLEDQTPEGTTTYNNGKIDVPANLSAIVTVTKDNVKTALIDSGYYRVEDSIWSDPPPVEVGIVLPTYEERRRVYDDTRFYDAFEAAGYDVQILVSRGYSGMEKSNVEFLISHGIKVLILCPVDGTAAAAAAEEARAAGVKVIAYERLIRDTEAVDYSVAFDSVAIGGAQGQYLVDRAQGKDNPLYLYAGRASDNEAFLSFQGAWEVLQPKIADGTFVVKNSSEAVALQTQAMLTREEMSRIIGQITTGWTENPNPVKNLAKANLKSAQAADKGNVFILAPSDASARAIADVFAADPDVRSYVITGQDAEEASVRYILDGKQSMTVFTDRRTPIKYAVAAAVAFLEGKTPEITTTYNNGKIDVPAKSFEIVTVTKDNVQAALIDSGYYRAIGFTGLP